MNLEIVGISGTIQFVAFLYIVLVIIGGGDKKNVSHGKRPMEQYDEYPRIHGRR